MTSENTRTDAVAAAKRAVSVRLARPLGDVDTTAHELVERLLDDGWRPPIKTQPETFRRPDVAPASAEFRAQKLAEMRAKLNTKRRPNDAQFEASNATPTDDETSES